MRIGAFRNGRTVGLRSLRGVMVSPRLECMASVRRPASQAFTWPTFRVEQSTMNGASWAPESAKPDGCADTRRQERHLFGHSWLNLPCGSRDLSELTWSQNGYRR